MAPFCQEGNQISQNVSQPSVTGSTPFSCNEVSRYSTNPVQPMKLKIFNPFEGHQRFCFHYKRSKIGVRLTSILEDSCGMSND